MPPTIVVDHCAPGGQRAIDLPADFVERIECQNQPLEPFLAANSPLTAHSSWVCVRTPASDTIAARQGVCNLEYGVSSIKARGNDVTMSEVDEVARRTCCTYGKWKIKVETVHLEHMWGRIARAVHSGQLAKLSCTSAKVSTTITQDVRSRGSTHTIYVYLDNYLDEENVRKLRHALQQFLDEDTKLGHFKPDLYTYLKWGEGRMPPLIPVDRLVWMEPACSACGKTSEKLKKCTACQSAQYCNKDCQRTHWKTHRKVCKPIGSSKKDVKPSGTSTGSPNKKHKSEGM